MLRVQTNFEFRDGRAVPVLKGVIVAAADAPALMHATTIHQQATLLESIKKRRREVLNRWTKLTYSLLTHDRIKKEYGSGAEAAAPSGQATVAVQDGSASAIFEGIQQRASADRAREEARVQEALRLSGQHARSDAAPSSRADQ